MKKVISAGHICLDSTPVFPAAKQYDRLSSLLIPGKLNQMEAADVHTGGSVANTGLPLVLHGGSSLSDSDFRTAVQKGVCKVDIFTDIDKAGKAG